MLLFNINHGIIDDILVRSEIDSKDFILSEDKQKVKLKKKPKYYLCMLICSLLLCW